ncbi:unnamed protein product [Protopolystoma xenopodis]|uniref:Uncharacterized protein n=1 Tax=Protopolystoma xenopodis TaxID=117903 RepID=A0A448WR45_9PLAT|nr:unnamed protein product [Protopolystoma xenopodis]
MPCSVVVSFSRRLLKMALHPSAHLFSASFTLIRMSPLLCVSLSHCILVILPLSLSLSHSLSLSLYAYPQELCTADNADVDLPAHACIAVCFCQRKLALSGLVSLRSATRRRPCCLRRARIRKTTRRGRLEADAPRRATPTNAPSKRLTLTQNGQLAEQSLSLARSLSLALKQPNHQVIFQSIH